MQSSISSAVYRLERIRQSRYIPVFPEPKQAAAILHPAREVLYGGAAGGGKSITLLIAALEWADQYPVQSLLLRRTFPDLSQPSALIPTAAEWLGPTDATWNGNLHQWSFPSGATLTFGYMDAENDRFRYQGAAYHFIGFDELTQFREVDYRYVFSRQRRVTGSEIPIRTVATSNPGGLGHDWVYGRFITAKEPGRVFISAQLEDNPHLDREEYERSLQELDPITYRQLRHGDWTIKPAGGWFERSNIEIVDQAPVMSRAVRYWDMAATVPKANTDPDWTVGLLLGKGSDGYLYILDVLRFRKSPVDTEQVMRRAGWADASYQTDIWLEQEPGAGSIIAIDHLIRDVLVGQPVFADKKDANKKDRARPLAAQVARKNIRMLRAPWNGALLDELDAFPFGSHDDQVDALSGAFAKLTEGGLMAFAMQSDQPVRTGWDGYQLDDELHVVNP